MKIDIDSINSLIKSFPTFSVIQDCDLNELLKKGTGLFVAMSKLQNAPITDAYFHYYVIQIRLYSSDTYGIQYIYSVHTEKIFYVRRKVNDKWEDWTKI